MLFFKAKQHIFTLSTLLLVVAVITFAFFLREVEAAPNYEINYQGKLLDTSNIAVANDQYNMRFWLLTSPSAATTSAIWSEELTGTDKVQVTNGLFSVMLGSTTPLDGIDFNQTLYLGVEIGGTSTLAWDGEMSPRKILGAVPAAFYASTSSNVGGVASTSLLRSDVDDTASGLLTFTGGLISNSSSTITNLTSLIATTTDLVLGGRLYDGSNSAGANGYILQTSGSQTTWVSTTTLGIHDALTLAGTPNYLTLSNQVLTLNQLDLADDLNTFTSANLLGKLTDEVGGGLAVFNDAPTFTGTSTFASVEVTNGLYGAGIAWEAQSAAGDNDSWRAVTYGNGLFVAVSNSGDRVMYSQDGVNWSTTTAAGDNDSWYGITYGNGLFVAVGDSSGSGNSVITSPDGVTWTTRSAAGDNDTWLGLTYGNGLFVAVGSSAADDTVMTSPDGITWTVRSAAGDNDIWRDVTYGNGLFVAVAAPDLFGDDAVMTSPDGITWTARSAAGSNDNWWGVTYGNGLFVAVGLGIGDDKVITSPDGINWTIGSAAGGNDDWNDVTYGNGLFVAVGSGGDYVMTSPDGITWTARTGSGSGWYGVTYGDGRFVAVGLSGDRVMTSGTKDETQLATDNVYQGGMSVLGGVFNIGTTTGSGSSYANNILNIASTTGTSLLTMDRFGYLGLGTTSPSRLLTVAGDIYGTGSVIGTSIITTNASSTYASTTNLSIYGALYDSTSSAGSNGYILQTTGSGVEWVATSSLGFGGGDGVSNWSLVNGALAPSTTVGIVVSASSTISDLSVTNGTTTNSTSTNLFATNLSWTNLLSTVGVANLTSEDFGSFTCNGSSCSIDDGALASTTLSAGNWQNGYILQASTTASGGFDWVSTSTLGITGGAFSSAGGYTALNTSSDFVGIGSSTPSSKLTIVPGGGEEAFRVASSTGSTTLLVNNFGDVEVYNGLYNAGLAWEAQSAADDDDNWYSVTYGNGIFVAVGYISGDRVMYSLDGVNWSTTTAAGDDDWWIDITYGNGLFVAVGSSGDRVMTSPDGINWTVRSAAGDNDNWYGVTYANGLFVAVGAGGSDYVMTSPDGINWTARSAAGDNDYWNDITYGNGLFVAIADTNLGQEDAVMTSPDGINWTVRSAAGDNDRWQAITYADGLYVAVGDDSIAADDYVMTSPDGINWTARSAAGDNDSWYGIAYGNGLFVAVGTSGDRVMTSPDGINWTARSAAGDNDSWGGITYGDGQFVAVGLSGDRVMTSGAPDSTQLAHNNIYQGGMSVLGGAFNIGTSTPSGNNFANNILNIASTTGTSLLTMDRFGYLGLGTTSPSRLLTIQGGDLWLGGNFTATGTLSAANGNFTVDSNGLITSTSVASSSLSINNWTNGYILQASTTAPGGFDWVATSTLGFPSAGFASSGGYTTLTNATDFVGIGSSTPTAKLTVQGDAGQTANLFAIASSTGDTLVAVDAYGGFTQYLPMPQQIATLSPGTIYGIDTQGDYVYVAAGSPNGFKIIDFSDPTSPEELGNVNVPDGTRKVKVAGNYAYVLTYNATGDELVVIDITKPENPVTVGGYDWTAGGGYTFYDLALSGKYLFVVGGGLSGHEFLSFDVSDPTSPELVDSVNFGSQGANSILIEDNYAYIGTSDTSQKLQIYDISDPADLTKVGGVSLDNNGTAGIVKRGQYIFMAGSSGSHEFEVVDVSDPTTPVEVESIALNGSPPQDMVVSGNYAFIVSQDNGENLMVVDISDPLVLSVVHEMDFGQSIQAVGILGNYLITGGGGGSQMRIFDIGGFTAPTAEIGTIFADKVDSNDIVSENVLVNTNLNVGHNALISGALTVSGNASTSLAVNAPLLTLGGNNVRDSYMSFVGNRANNSTWSIGYDQTGSAFRISSSSSLGTNDYFSILGNGDVGIGSSTPSRKLTVQGGDVWIGGNLTATGTITAADGNFVINSSGLITSASVASSSLSIGNWANGYVLQASTTASGGFDWVSTSTLGLGGSSDDTVVTVAASDTPATEKAAADYIADGTNDEVTIQSAIDYVYNGGTGGTVILLSGTFNIADQINLATSSRLVGQGTSTVLRLASSAPNNIAILSAGQAHYTYVGHLHLEGNRANNTNDNQNGVTFANTSSSTIEHVIANDFQDYGIYLDTSHHNTISQSTANNNEDYGYLLQDSDYNTITENITNNNNYGSYLSSSYNNILSNNIANGNTTTGFYGQSSYYTTYTSNTAENNGSNGFHLHSSYYNTVSANTSNNNGGSGFYVRITAYGNFIANTAIGNATGFFVDFFSSNQNLTNNYMEGNTTYSFQVTDSSSVTLEGNYLIHDGGGATDYAIFIDNESDNTSIIDNTIVAAGTAPLIFVEQSATDNTTIAGNIFQNSELDDTTFITDNGTNTIYDQFNRETLLTKTEVGYNLLSITGSTTATTTSITQLGTGDIFTLDTASGRVLTATNNGYIGIGTTSPSRKLTIQGGDLWLGGNFIATGTATTTNLAVTNNLNFGGVTGSAWSDFCTSITGGSGLCDGTDDGGAGANWVLSNGALTPSTTVGITIGASSTISDLTVTNGTTTNATSTNLFATNFSWTNLLSTVGVANLNAEDFGDFTCNGSTCSVDDSALASTTLSAGNWQNGYILQASTTASGGFDWVATSSLGITGGAFSSAGGYTILNTATDFVGIGSSTPSAKLTIQADSGNTSNLFVVASSTVTASSSLGYAKGLYSAIDSFGKTTITGKVLNPEKVAVLNPDSINGRDMVVRGDYAYVTGYDADTMYIVNISNPAQPKIEGTWDPNDITVIDRTYGIDVAGNYAYVVGNSSENIAVVDISDPTNPTAVAYWDPQDSSVFSLGTKIKIIGNYAYALGAVAGVDDIVVIDISDPTNPTYVTSYTVQGGAPKDIEVSGSYAYFTDTASDAVEVIDVSDPRNPQYVGMYQPVDSNIFQDPEDITISGNYAYVAGGNADNVIILDISDPRNISLAANWDPNDTSLLQDPQAIAVSGNYVYVGIVGPTASDNFVVLDVSSSTNPVLVADYSIVNNAYAVVPSGNHLFISNSTEFTVLDIGGLDVSNLYAGDIRVDQLRVDQTALFDNGLNMRGSLNVGQGGYFGGALSILGNSSTTAINNTAALTLGGSNLRDSYLSFNSRNSSTSLDVWSVGLDQTDDAFRISSSSSLGTNDYFSILKDGKVGIGSSTPSRLLTVAGDIYGTGSITGSSILSTLASTTYASTTNLSLYGSLFDRTGSAGTNGMILQTTGAGTTWVATSSLGITSDDTVVTVAASDSSATEKAAADYIADGTADQVQIQAAIDYAFNGGAGGTVELLSGTFNISNQIDLASSSRLMGQGTSTVLRFINSAPDNIGILYASQVNDTYVGHLNLQGNRSNNTNDNQYGIYFANTDYSVIENVIANDFQDHGVYFLGSSNNTIRFSTANDNEDYGFYISAGSGSSDNTLISNTANNNNYGFYLTAEDNILTSNVANNNTVAFYINSDNNTFTNNTANNNTSAFSLANYASSHTFTNNTANNNSTAFDLGNFTSNNTLTGNIASNNTLAFSLFGSTNNTLTSNTAKSNSTAFSLFGSTNNTFTSNTATINSTSAFALLNSSNNTLEGNYLYNNGGGSNSSISVDGTSDDVAIIDNTITATGTAALIRVDDSAQDRTTIAGNVFQNSELDDSTFITDNGTGTIYDQFNRETLLTSTEVGYNLLSITGSTTATTTSITQLGTGDIFTLDNASGRILTATNNGYIGIGTSSPSWKLSVAGTSTFQGGQVKIGDGWIGMGAGSGLASNAINVGISNSVNTGSGVIAIGRSNTTGSSGAASSIVIGYLNDTGAGSGATAIGYSNDAIGDQAVSVGYDNTINFGQYSSAIGRLNSINSGANYSSAYGQYNAISSVRASAFGWMNDVSGAGASVFGSYITNNIASSTMIGPSDSAKLTILGSGNVGIGTTSPNAKLTVTSKIGDTGALFKVASSSNGTATTTYFSIDEYGTTTIAGGLAFDSVIGTAWSDFCTSITGGAGLCDGTDNSGAEANWVLQNGALVPSTTVGIVVSASSTIGDGTGAGGLTIYGGATTTGDAYFASNVGIGTLPTTNALQVQGNTEMNGTLTLDAGTNAFRINSGSANYGVIRSIINAGGSADSGWEFASGQASYSFDTNLYRPGGTAGAGILVTDGIFAVGSSSPNAKLTIEQGGGGSGPLFQIASSSDGTATTTHFIVDAFGRVGIGTTSPVSPLSIVSPAIGPSAPEVAQITLEASGATGYAATHFKGNGEAFVMGVGNASEVAFGVANKFFVLDVTDATARFVIDGSGNVGIGTTTPDSILSLYKTGLTGSVIGGVRQYLEFDNSTESAIYYGDNAYIVNAPTATSTLVGKIIRVEDSTSLGNVVRGLEVQADEGTNTKGENTALSGFARTFGVRGTTDGQAGGTYLPAGVYAETLGTTQGNALRAYSGTITTEDLVSIFHDTSDFVGTGLSMNFGNSGGTFPAASNTAMFVNLQTAGVSKFMIGASGSTTIGEVTGSPSEIASLRVVYGGICVDNDGSCNASTTGRITSVSSATGNSDLAEMYFSRDALETGEIVSLSGGLSVRRSDEENEENVVGVVSTKPGLLLGFDDSPLITGERAYPVGLSGRVPVKLSTENGPITKGDKITLSSVPGVGMKATEEGQRIVGVALEDYEGESAYSEGFLNQFGDDLIEEYIVDNDVEIDPRTQDGCYYGAGGALGEEEECIPKDVSEFDTPDEPTEPQITRDDVLNELIEQEPTLVSLGDEREVAVGQSLMFIELGHNRLATTTNILAELASTTLLYEDGEAGESIWDRIKALASNFVDGVLTLTGIKADKVETQELCVDDVCINADDLRALLEGGTTGGGTPSQNNTSNDSNTGTDTSTSGGDDTTTEGTGTDGGETGTSTDTATDTSTSTEDTTVTGETASSSPDGVDEGAGGGEEATEGTATTDGTETSTTEEATQTEGDNTTNTETNVSEPTPEPEEQPVEEPEPAPEPVVEEVPEPIPEPQPAPEPAQETTT